MMEQWYVVKTKPHKEEHVSKQFGRLGYKIFIPRLDQSTGGKPLFPSYIFICSNLSDPAVNRLIRYTRGVSYILGDQTGPRSIDAEVIKTIQEQTVDGVFIDPRRLFHQGEKVSVRRGILKDLQGIVERHLPSEKRVLILFKWLSTTMRAKLRVTDLEKAA